MDRSAGNPRLVSVLPSDKREVLILVNPQAGRRLGRRLVEELEARLRERHFRVERYVDIMELQEAAAESMRDGSLRAIVAAGGDGTAALVVNRTSPAVPVMVLPQGNENLLAKHLTVKADPERICRIIEEGVFVQLDAGEVNGRVFLLMASCGFDAEVVRRVHQNRTGPVNDLSYVKAILQTVRTYQYPELRVCCGSLDSPPSAELCTTAKWAFVFNLPRYAAGLRLAPGADGSDGRLDLCTFKNGGVWQGLRYLSGVVLGRHLAWRDCGMLRTQWVRIESEAAVPYQVDGDPAGYLPVEIRVVPERLTLLVPRSWAGFAR